MSQPFSKCSTLTRKRLFWLSLGMTLAVALVLQKIDGALQTSAAPQDIVSYELAGSAAAAGRILASWDAAARLHASFSLGIDYLFMLAYAVTLALAALWAGAKLSGWAQRLGVALAWGMGAAALADATENFFLWRMLTAGPADGAAGIARGAALLKFTLILLTLVYIIIALALRLLHSITRR